MTINAAVDFTIALVFITIFPDDNSIPRSFKTSRDRLDRGHILLKQELQHCVEHVCVSNFLRGYEASQQEDLNTWRSEEKD